MHKRSQLSRMPLNPTALKGAAMDKSARPRRVKALGEVSIRVRDLDAMQKFYEEVIGLEVLRRDESFVFFKVAEDYSPVVEDFVPCACVHLCI
jgi:bleomycin resistance family protein